MSAWSIVLTRMGFRRPGTLQSKQIQQIVWKLMNTIIVLNMDDLVIFFCNFSIFCLKVLIPNVLYQDEKTFKAIQIG